MYKLLNVKFKISRGLASQQSSSPLLLHNTNKGVQNYASWPIWISLAIFLRQYSFFEIRKNGNIGIKGFCMRIVENKLDL